MTTATAPRRRAGTSTGRTALAAVLVALATGGTAWLRIGSPAQGVAWAEDSGRFLNERLTLGPVRALWHPYDGYLHLLPRLVVDAAVAVGRIDLYALVVTALSCVVLGAVCGAVFVLAREVVRPWPLRLVLAAVPAIIPLAPVEIAGTAANLHWYLLFAAPWLFASRPRSWWSAALVAVAVGFVTLSEIQAAVFLPLLLLNRRNVRVLPVAGVAVLGVAAQLTAALTHPRSSSHQSGITSFRDITAGWFAQAVGGSWDGDVRAVGATVAAHGWWVVAVPGLLVLATIVVAVLRADWRTRWMLVATTGGALVVWWAALVVNRTPGTRWSTFSPAMWADTGAFRYAAASSMFLTAAVVLAASVFLTRSTAGADRAGAAGAPALTGRTSRGEQVLGAALVLAVVVVAALGAGTVPTRAAGPVWATQVAHRAGFCAAHPGDTVRIGAMPRVAGWDATLPCAMVQQAVGR